MASCPIGRNPDANGALTLSIGSLFRRPVFADPDAARAVARAQRASGVWGRSRCLAWVLMPDRWHALVTVGAGDSLERLARRFKQETARAVEARFRVNGWLWERGFEANPLAAGEDEACVARRLVRSPVLAGLAESVGCYPYWDAIWLDGRPRIDDEGDLPAPKRTNTMAG